MCADLILEIRGHSKQLPMFKGFASHSEVSSIRLSPCSSGACQIHPILYVYKPIQQLESVSMHSHSPSHFFSKRIQGFQKGPD